ncbi:MAG: substrate-binding domain-containing protein [Leucobacter sp.]
MKPHSNAAARLSRLSHRRVKAAVVGLAVASLALVGCASGSPDAGKSGSGGDSAGAGTAEGVKIAIMGGAPDDPFWSMVKNGADAATLAVTAAGGKVEFVSMPNYDNFNNDAAKLVANIQAMDPDVAVIPNWVPESQNENIKALTSSGIPVVIYNTGQDTVEEVGGEIYIGSDDHEAGIAGGARLAEDGSKNILCVNTLPGTVNIDARCSGVKEGAEKGGSSSKDLNLPSTSFGDPTAITQAIKGALLEDEKVDTVITIGAQDSDSAAAAIEQANVGDRVKLASFDVSDSQLERIKDGTQLFAIDQQPYAQGFYGISYAFQLAAYAIELPEDRILTGPALIDAENVDVVIKAAESGIR